MKKTYQKPEMKSVKIQTMRIFAGSPDGFSKTLNATGGNGSNALSRDRAWEEEDW